MQKKMKHKRFVIKSNLMVVNRSAVKTHQRHTVEKFIALPESDTFLVLEFDG